MQATRQTYLNDARIQLVSDANLKKGENARRREKRWEREKNAKLVR